MLAGDPGYASYFKKTWNFESKNVEANNDLTRRASSPHNVYSSAFTRE